MRSQCAPPSIAFGIGGPYGIDKHQRNHRDQGDRRQPAVPVKISDAKGHPVTITGRSESKPLLVTFKLTTGSTAFSCAYSAASLNGHFSNATNSVSVSRRELRKSAGGRRCLPEVYFSAVYGPAVDSSLKGSPRVFVN